MDGDGWRKRIGREREICKLYAARVIKANDPWVTHLREDYTL